MTEALRNLWQVLTARDKIQLAAQQRRPRERPKEPRKTMASRLGLVRCEHCGRQFNPHSAARHIPWCAKQRSDNRRAHVSPEKRLALERYKWRIGYRPSNQIRGANQAPFGGGGGGGGGGSAASGRQVSGGRAGYGIGGASNKPAATTRTTETGRASHSSSATTTTGGSGSGINGFRDKNLNYNGDNGNCKRTLLNSTGTMSSSSPAHSASSSASFGLGSLASSTAAAGTTGSQVAASGRRQQNQARSKPASRQLARSISSLTLTKHQGAPTPTAYGAKGSPLPGAGSIHVTDSRPAPAGCAESGAKRAKSLSNLCEMSNIVEILAKRVDEIYKQNQILLASLSVANLSIRQRRALADSSDEPRNGELSAGSSAHELDSAATTTRLLRCHHCKTSSSADANYCRSCGCRLGSPAADSSVG